MYSCSPSVHNWWRRHHSGLNRDCHNLYRLLNWCSWCSSQSSWYKNCLTRNIHLHSQCKWWEKCMLSMETDRELPVWLLGHSSHILDHILKFHCSWFCSQRFDCMKYKRSCLCSCSNHRGSFGKWVRDRLNNIWEDICRSKYQDLREDKELAMHTPMPVLWDKWASKT